MDDYGGLHFLYFYEYIRLHMYICLVSSYGINISRHVINTTTFTGVNRVNVKEDCLKKSVLPKQPVVNDCEKYLY